jgi:hypothetical protein
MIKLTEILTEETPIYKDWDEFVNPHHIIVHLKNGKKLKVDRSRVKGGNTTYHTILKAFNDNNYKITNKIVAAMMDRLGEDVSEATLTESLDIKPIVARIAKSTDKNEHTGAVMELAVFLNDTKSFKKLEAVDTIHTIEGSMPSEISKYRDSILKDLMSKVKSKYGSDAAKEVNGAF